MNELIVKKSIIFSFIFGALLGLLAIFPFLNALCFITLAFLSSPIVVCYMKKIKQLGIIDNQQGAIIGAFIGLFSTICFFISFVPMVLILHLIFRSKYYSYAIPYMFEDGVWLLFIIVFMVAVFFAVTNSVSGMATSYCLNFIEKKPEHHDAQLDIKIED